MNVPWPAWECRDQVDQAELYYNQPLRAKNRRLEDENMALKRLLHKNGIAWQMGQTKPARPSSSRVTRLSMSKERTLPHLPLEIQLTVLEYAMTSNRPIVDPLCKSRPERMLPHEKEKRNEIAIHFLATCRAFHYEGTRFLWSNNSFLFTSPESLRQFADLDLGFRQNIRHVTFRLIARFYDDEDRIHRLPNTYHHSLRSSPKLVVQRRLKEKTLARRGFRAYAWYQLIDFLEALLPPYNPSCKIPLDQPRPRLLPALETLRIDFVNFINDLLQYPPQYLHDLASHQLGCMLNEIVLTGIPTDESGLRVSTELSGLLKDEGLLIDHTPTLVAVKDGVRVLRLDTDFDPTIKVVRGMHGTNVHHFYDEHVRHDWSDFPPAPRDEGEPPFSPYHSCRTIWKKVPVRIDGHGERKWELFDRVSGLPWDEIEEEATMFDSLEQELGPLVCENCGECHPGALHPEELMDIYEDEL